MAEYKCYLLQLGVATPFATGFLGPPCIAFRILDFLVFTRPCGIPLMEDEHSSVLTWAIIGYHGALPLRLWAFFCFQRNPPSEGLNSRPYEGKPMVNTWRIIPFSK